MDLLDELAERRILESLARGELDDLPGAGRPLDLDDDTLVPPELRVAYRILKNAGYLPPEVGVRREIRAVDELLAIAEAPDVRAEAERRLQMLLRRLDMMRPGRRHPAVEREYHQRLRARLDPTADP
ncbi:MAG: DUF1992 domain-containing protein [Gammaproteobacteria bacterium]|jgi:hypothetical protein